MHKISAQDKTMANCDVTFHDVRDMTLIDLASIMPDVFKLVVLSSRGLSLSVVIGL